MRIVIFNNYLINYDYNRIYLNKNSSSVTYFHEDQQPIRKPTTPAKTTITKTTTAATTTGATTATLKQFLGLEFFFAAPGVNSINVFFVQMLFF